MATYNKFQQFVEDLAEKVHNLGVDALTVALTPAASAPVVTNSILSNLTEIAYTNLSARLISITSSLQTTGTYKLTLTDLVLTASGGSVAAFRYICIYNDTPAAPLNPLIGFYDFGSDLTLADGETLTIDFDATNGFITIV